MVCDVAACNGAMRMKARIKLCMTKQIFWAPRGHVNKICNGAQFHSLFHVTVWWYAPNSLNRQHSRFMITPCLAWRNGIVCANVTSNALKQTDAPSIHHACRNVALTWTSY